MSLSANTSLRLSDRSHHVLEHLSRRGSVWPDASSAAIRNLLLRLTTRPTGSRNGEESNTDSFDDGTIQVPEDGDASIFPDDARPPHNAIPESAPIQNATRIGSAFDSGSVQPPVNSNGGSGRLDFNTSIFDSQNVDWNDFANSSISIDPNMMLGDHNNLDPFSRFDIPFWLEQPENLGFLE